MPLWKNDYVYLYLVLHLGPLLATLLMLRKRRRRLSRLLATLHTNIDPTVLDDFNATQGAVHAARALLWFLGLWELLSLLALYGAGHCAGVW